MSGARAMPASLDALASSIIAALARAVAACEREAPAPRPVEEAVAEARLEARIPALHGEPLADGAMLLANVRRLAEALRAPGEPVAGAAAAVAAALGGGRAGADLDALAADAVAGDWDAVRALAPRLDVDEDALVTLLDYAVRAPLRLAAARLRATIARRSWPRGTCPACGAPPILAELRGKDRVRVLRCARCGSAWEFPRVACPACGERDHRKLTTLHGEGEEDFRRVDCCESCRTYVKAIARLDPLSADALMEADLETVGLDWVAVERGYHR